MGKRAVFTIVNNENIFLPIWLEHYRKYFNPEDIFILDHDTTDGSTSGLDVNVQKISYPQTFHHDWLRGQVQEELKRLLGTYERVLFAEADEIVWHHGQPLDEFMDTFEGDMARCAGWGLIHDIDSEPDLEPGEKILNRKYSSVQSVYGKTLITKVPLAWVKGFHELAGNHWPEKGMNNGSNPVMTPDLHLLHLRHMDRRVMLARNAMRLGQTVNGDAFDCKSVLRSDGDVDSDFRQFRQDGRWWKAWTAVPDWMRSDLAHLHLPSDAPTVKTETPTTVNLAPPANPNQQWPGETRDHYMSRTGREPVGRSSC